MRRKKGFTLLETMVALLVVVFLVVGMEVGMNAALRVYREASFVSDSAMLSDILNCTVSDLLRYAKNIKTPKLGEENVDESGSYFVNFCDFEQVPFLFTNLEYGSVAQDAYLYLSEADGILQIKNLYTDTGEDLINRGAYAGLTIAAFDVEYVKGNRGAYFMVRYTIASPSERVEPLHVERCIRPVN